MPYVMTRDELGLKLKQGDKLSYEAGKLPDALKFAANWAEGEPEAKPKTKAELAVEKKAAKEAEEAQAKLDEEAAADLPQE